MGILRKQTYIITCI